MGKVFMTVVGTGFYRECNYELNGKADSDRFIQKALMRLLLQQGIKFDKVVCFMTEESRRLNWEKYVRYDKEGKLSEEGEGLQPFFQEVLPDACLIPTEIPFATTEQQILETFQTMYEVLEQGDEVTLDVTHGFRSTPMLSMSVLNYAKELKNVKTDAIYYGAFESKEEHKPIINLTMYNNILAWSNAAHSFVKYGSSEEIYDMTYEMNRQAHINRSDDNTYQQVKKVADALKGFTNMIQTSRGNGGELKKRPDGVNAENSIMYADQRVREEYSKLDHKTVFPPLDKLLDHAIQSIDGFHDQDIVGTGIETVRWCIEKDMVQQGYTALEETMITYCCIALGYSSNYIEQAIRVQGVSRAITEFLKNHFKEENVDGYRLEIPEKEEKEKERKEKENAEAFEKAMKKIPFEIIQTIQQIKERRNDINHFGMRKQPFKAKNLQEELEKDFRKFEELREKWGESFEKQRQQ